MSRLVLLVLMLMPSYTGLVAQIPPHELHQANRRGVINLTDTPMLKAWLNQANEYYGQMTAGNRKQDSALYYITAAKKWSDNHHYIKGIQDALAIEAKVLHRKRQFLLRAGDNTAMIHLIDSFEKTALKTIDRYGDRTARANVLMALANAYDWRTEGPDRHAVLYKEAAELYRERGHKKHEGLALIQHGQSMIHGEMIHEAEISLLEAVKILSALGYTRMHMAYMGLSHVYISTGRYKEGTKYALEAVRVGERFNDASIDMADVYKNLGCCYEIANDPDNAAVYFRKGLEIAKGNGSVTEIYSATGQMVKLMVRNATDSAIFILQGLLRQYPVHPRDEALRDVYVQLLRCYNRKKQLNNAEVYANKVLDFTSAMPEMSLYRSYALSPVIDYYILSRQYPKAIKLLSICKNIEEQNGQLPALRGVYSRLYRIDSALNDYKAALNSYKLWRSIVDSLDHIALEKQSAELRIQFETEQQQKDISLLQQENRLKSERLSRSSLERNAVIAFALLLFVIFCLLYYQFHLKKVANKNINSKNLMLEKLLQEKEWLLKEVHHRVKNNLQTVVSLLESQAAKLHDEALDAIQESQQRVFAISLIHKKLYQAENIKTVEMATYIPELTGYINEMIGEASTLTFEYNIESILLDVSHAVPVALIVNEAVTNAIKYAFEGIQVPSKVIRISMNRTGKNERLQIIIADNGKGLPDDLLRGGGAGLGLRLLFGLTDDLGGTLVITNENGTSITLAFPEYRNFRSLY